MPQPTMKMFLPNSNSTYAQMAALTNLVSAPKPIKNTPLNSAMIGRIHNAKSGCGSCGRK